METVGLPTSLSRRVLGWKVCTPGLRIAGHAITRYVGLKSRAMVHTHVHAPLSRMPCGLSKIFGCTQSGGIKYVPKTRAAFRIGLKVYLMSLVPRAG